MKKFLTIILVLSLVLCLVACSVNGLKAFWKPKKLIEYENLSPREEAEEHIGIEGRIMLAAAASLKNIMDEEIIPLFNEEYPTIEVIPTFDSSGKLQTQIEEGAEIDVFISASMKQMDELNEQGLLEEDSIVKLLENRIVLIAAEGSQNDMQIFEDIVNAESIAIGNPESVPVGYYAKEAMENLELWEEASDKLSLGTNVIEVLNWVAEGSADVGIVYATDAAGKDNVVVIAEASDEIVSKIIYPVGIVKDSRNRDTSQAFVEFLLRHEMEVIFKKYGFSVYK